MLKNDFHKLSFSFLKQVCLANLSLDNMSFKAFKEFMVGFLFDYSSVYN